MNETYGDDFYNKEDAEWKTEADIRSTLKNDEDGDLLVGQDDDDGGLYDDGANDDEQYSGREDGEDDGEAYDDDDEEAYWDEQEDDHVETELERGIKEKMMDELYKLDYEDIVAGQPTRFKYRKVEANDYGLTTEEILFARDTTLRQFVSLKQLAPYNEQEFRVNSRKRRKFRDLLKQDLEEQAAEESMVGQTNVNQEQDDNEDQPAGEDIKTSKKKSRRLKKNKKSKDAHVSSETTTEKSTESKQRDKSHSKSTVTDEDDSLLSMSKKNPSADDEASNKAGQDKTSASLTMKKDKSRKRKRNKNKHKESDVVPGVSASRLAAYGL
jgi:protein KRI1